MNHNMARVLCQFVLLVVMLAQIQPAASAKKIPIIFMHGIFDKPFEPDFATQYLTKMVEGVVVYPVRLWDGAWSAYNLKRQLKDILPFMENVMANHSDTGVAFLCYSQGGVICRAAVEMLQHNVHTMITLGSPLAGQYGVTSDVAPYLPDPTADRSELWRFFYSSLGQDISFADYWNDPHHQKEFSDPAVDVLTARLNNQTGHPNSTEYKANFLRLRQLVMVGGPNDTIITPWQSSQFGFYDANETVLPMTAQPWYKNDAFGLKTLNGRGAVHVHTVPNVHHLYWYRTQAVFDCCVVPYIKKFQAEVSNPNQ